MKRNPQADEIMNWRAAAASMVAKGKYEQYPMMEFRLVTMDDISAREYMDSDRLDWDGLSDV